MQNIDKYTISIKGKEDIKLEIQYNPNEAHIANEIEKGICKKLNDEHPGNYSFIKKSYSKKIEEVQEQNLGSI
ncbi:MAG: hypothetical protein WCW53_16545 [Syntrophales bacterium]|jgi:hypothetical protein